MKNLLYGLVGLLVLAGTAIGGFFGLNKKQDATYVIGDQVGNFSLPTVDGRTVSLSDVAGTSGTILIFTSNTCPFSKLYDGRILQLQDVYGDVGYPVVLINPSDPALKPGDHPDELKKWVSGNNFSSVYLVDNGEIYLQFGAVKTPEVFLLDGEKKLRYRGAIDNSAQGAENVSEKYLENAIRALQNNGDPDPTETRAMGCVIKA